MGYCCEWDIARAGPYVAVVSNSRASVLYRRETVALLRKGTRKEDGRTRTFVGMNRALNAVPASMSESPPLLYLSGRDTLVGAAEKNRTRPRVPVSPYVRNE